jgi:hypothetical protein
MAINPFFKDYSGEQNLVEDLTIEIIKTMGRDMIYIPRNPTVQDELYGEQKGSYFKDGVSIEMYIDSISGFEGQGDVATKFGIEVRDNVTLTLSKKRFIQEVQNKFPSITRPREGDLVFFPLARALFEINFVEHENPFYQHGKLYSYKLTCELFSYSNEEMQTGNTDIDSVENDNMNDIGENETIDTLDNDIIDFTDIDPFSEGQY